MLLSSATDRHHARKHRLRQRYRCARRFAERPGARLYTSRKRPARRRGIGSNCVASCVIDDLDPTTIERLVQGAKRVQDELVCPECIAHYLRRVVDAIRERVSYRYVLDDRDAILALAERARACRDFVEVRVRIRRHGQKFRARGGASMCEVLRRGKWRGPPPPAVKVALDDSLGPRPAFAPRTGQFVVP